MSFPYFYEDGAVASPSLVHAIDMSEKIDLISVRPCQVGVRQAGMGDLRDWRARAG